MPQPDSRLYPFARLSGLRLIKLNLDSVRFDFADLRHAALDRCVLTNCLARNIDCSSTRLLEVVANSTNFSKGRFLSARIFSSSFDNAVFQSTTFERSNIADCHFSNANLCQSDLTSTTIERGVFTSAQLTSSRMSNITLLHCSFNEANLDFVDMRAASLQSSDFRGATLRDALMSHGRFDGCSYTHATMKGLQARDAIFTKCDFTFADFSDSDFSTAVFIQCNFSNASFARAILNGASFQGGALSNASFENASIGNTIFADVDLREALALDSLSHKTPSSIGVDALYRSGGWAPNLFLSKTGIPDIFLLFLPELIMAKFSPLFVSCFISYSSKDRLFASRLDDELRKRGIHACIDTRDFKPGDFIREGIQTGILQQDKVLLCASRNSLQNSFWVDEEVTTTLQKEERIRRETGNKVSLLIPIDLDGFLFTDECKSAVKAQLISRVVANFQGWKDDPKLIENQMTPLLAALKARRYKATKGATDENKSTDEPTL